MSGPVVVVRGQQVRAAVLGRLDREGQEGRQGRRESRGFQDRKEDLVFREIQDPAAIQVNKDQQALKVFQVLLGTQVLPVLKDQWGRKVRKEFLEILACQGQREPRARRGLREVRGFLVLLEPLDQEVSKEFKVYRGQSARKARWGRLAVKGRRVNAVRQEPRESKVYLVLPVRPAVRDPRANVEQQASRAQ